MLIVIYVSYSQHQAQLLQFIMQMYKKKQFLPQRLSSFRESPGKQTLREGEAGKGRCVYHSVDRSHGDTRVTFKPQEALGILQDKASSGHHTRIYSLFHQVINVFRVHSSSTAVDKKCIMLSVFQVLI